MSRFIFPTILILISGGLLFFFVNPTYSRINEIKQGTSAYDSALNKSKELQALRDSLLAEYNTISSTNLDKLKKMVPDHVDNVRLIIEIDSIASRYGMTVQDATLSSQSESENDDVRSIFEASVDKKQSMTLSFSVVAPYESFLSFLRDLEDNLRIVDIESVAFSASDIDLNEYTVTLKTYWLTPN